MRGGGSHTLINSSPIIIETEEDRNNISNPINNQLYFVIENSKMYLHGINDWYLLTYSHPSYTSHQSGLYKISVDGTGHVNGATAVKKSDITELGIPGAVDFLYNWLDNSNFKNPVNQRGKTTFSSGVGYLIDRWKCNGSAGTFTVTSSGLKIQTSDSTKYSEIIQKVENISYLTGKEMTYAVKFAEYGLVILNFIFGTNNSAHKNNSVSIIHWDSNSFYIRLAPGVSNVTVEWAALYEGTYTEETLPKYNPKGYETELMACQRYFINNIIVCDLTNEHGSYYTSVLLPIPMRIAPTVTVKSIAGNTGYISYWNGTS